MINKKPSTDALKKLHKICEDSISTARQNAVLGKHQDPTWIQMMNHIDLAFDNFQGIRGFWNIITNQWIVIMTDASYVHELLKDAISDIESVEFNTSSGLQWTEAQNAVAFEIGNRCDTVHVRASYYGDKDYDNLTPEKVAAIEYRIREEVLPKLKPMMYDQYPYQDKPRILSNIKGLDIDKINTMYESGGYTSVANGSFRYLVYRLKGMDAIEDILEFEQWLKED